MPYRLNLAQKVLIDQLGGVCRLDSSYQNVVGTAQRARGDKWDIHASEVDVKV
jgi:hypothetical protein